ncbi:MAG: hypothetical protein D6737_08175 [Chloroflexi bacterium]|nr:MAG: hypothetical protein CUN54_03560 [Phototrophicales bacterium]RMF80348.1 MAG: hypothetical protein D6737_08175 [Chloroflexota bacterium]
MGHLTSRFVEHIRTWDTPSQVALVIALCLLVVSLFVAALGPDNLRQPSLIGFAGLILVTQVIVMWGNRVMVTPYTKAQRHYMAGEFDDACAILQQLYQQNEADLQAMTLLGNVYRQLGRLDESEHVLREALNEAPSHHFPLYGLGRTLLTQGRYNEAVTKIQQAFEAGAPVVIQFDLFEALYRQGNEDTLRTLIPELKDAAAEAHRRLMFQYILFRLGERTTLDDNLLREGLPHWVASVEVYAHTPYGKVLSEDVVEMQQLTASI